MLFLLDDTLTDLPVGIDHGCVNRGIRHGTAMGDDLAKVGQKAQRNGFLNVLFLIHHLPFLC